VFQAAAGSQQEEEMPPEVVAAKTADLRHTQAVMDSLPPVHPDSSGGHHGAHFSAGAHSLSSVKDAEW